MRSIIVKLTLAFLLIGLTGSVLVAVIIRHRTRNAFTEFILNRDQQALVNSLVNYYETNRDWTGVIGRLESAFEGRGQFIEGRDFRREGTSFSLVGADRTVLFSAAPGQTGKKLADADLEKAVPLVVDGETAGWLLLARTPPKWIPDSAEDLFLRNVNRATLFSALVAAALALILGSLLALTLTRPIRELTIATVEIAKGKLGMQVKVRSKDELGELAESFNKMSLDLERATRARRQMTADIAHDLRSPLSVITGYAEALSDGKLQGTPEVYEILHQETHHLNRLVDDLRTLSLVDAGEMPLYRQPANPRSLLERVAARHAVAAQQANITLRVEPGESLRDIGIDVERMAQVLDNLILNAFRYTPAGGEISLSATQAGDQVHIRVRDSGSGIPPDDLPHIFDRFYRGDSARRSNGESGLGLAIARSIVEAHGGTITAASAPGEGAMFTITLKLENGRSGD